MADFCGFSGSASGLSQRSPSQRMGMALILLRKNGVVVRSSI
jgi:hypothetical protein